MFNISRKKKPAWLQHRKINIRERKHRQRMAQYKEGYFILHLPCISRPYTSVLSSYRDRSSEIIPKHNTWPHFLGQSLFGGSDIIQSFDLIGQDRLLLLRLLMYTRVANTSANPLLLSLD